MCIVIVLLINIGGCIMQGIGIILIYVVILGAMWFLLMRPQKKEQKRIQAMLSTMEVGDTVLTTSGCYDTICNIQVFQ